MKKKNTIKIIKTNKKRIKPLIKKKKPTPKLIIIQ